MPPTGRKKPFSGKAKKEQLKNKKQKQREGVLSYGQMLIRSNVDEDAQLPQKLGVPPKNAGRGDAQRYALMFFRETNVEIKAKRALACEPLKTIPDSELDINVEEFFPHELNFPKRPTWSYEASREVLEAKEYKYFQDYVAGIQTKYNCRDIGFFELNLETWRQLWRVLEMSDIILLIVDIRFPAHMFPPSLYHYVVNTLKKDFILVLNKIDLVRAPVVCAWRYYFQDKYPKLRIAMFTTLPGYNLVGGASSTTRTGLQVRRRRGRFRLAAEGSQQLYEMCRDCVGDNLDISSWLTKIHEEMQLDSVCGTDDDDINNGQIVENLELLKAQDTSYFHHVHYKNQTLTIGCLGQPNVGKSSLINALMGRKVVSVSRTPGHTKHFQTIFLTSNVRLCDCPGLVFPSTVPKMIQVLMGSFPIAQLREPYTTVQFLAERLDLIKLLHIEHPENEANWSAMNICDGWALKRGYYTARAARLDSYRAANDILRMSLDGKICLCLRPPEYTTKMDFWKKHPDNEKVKWIQAQSETPSSTSVDTHVLLTSSNEEEEGDSENSNEEVSSIMEDSRDEEENDVDIDFKQIPKTSDNNKFAALQDSD